MMFQKNDGHGRTERCVWGWGEGRGGGVKLFPGNSLMIDDDDMITMIFNK